MHSIPHSKTSSLTRLNTSTKLRKTLQPSNSIILVNNDLSRYDDLIKKARETIYKFQNIKYINSKHRQKEVKC